MQRSGELVALRYTPSCWMKILMLSTRSSLNGGNLRAALDRESGLYKSYSWQQFVNCNLITYMNPTLKSLTVFVYPAITSSPSSLDRTILPHRPTRRRDRHQLAAYPVSPIPTPMPSPFPPPHIIVQGIIQHWQSSPHQHGNFTTGFAIGPFVIDGADVEEVEGGISKVVVLRR